MRKRIERSAVEMIEFFEEIGWYIGAVEKKLIKSSDYIDEYRNNYKDSEEYFTKAEQVINFFYEPEPEPEPDYKDWIGEDCVFSNKPFDNIIDLKVHLGILLSFTTSGKFRDNRFFYHDYCMLKKDYIDLIKEQSK